MQCQSADTDAAPEPEANDDVVVARPGLEHVAATAVCFHVLLLHTHVQHAWMLQRTQRYIWTRTPFSKYVYLSLESGTADGASKLDMPSSSLIPPLVSPLGMEVSVPLCRLSVCVSPVLAECASPPLCFIKSGLNLGISESSSSVSARVCFCCCKPLLLAARGMLLWREVWDDSLSSLNSSDTN